MRTKRTCSGRQVMLQQFYRLWRYADPRALYLMARFRPLREEFYWHLWQSAAKRIGAGIEKTRYGYLSLRRDGLTTFVERHRVMLDDHLTLNLMGNKALTYELLERKGMRVPRHLVFTLASLADAQAFRARHGGPVVVKPASGTGGGRGVTTSITTTGMLKRAARRAARYDATLMVEEQLAGQSYRLLFLDGKLIDAIRREPPHLTGDGRHTIKQLVDMENRRRLGDRPIVALSPLQIDADCCNTLAGQNLGARSRLAAGQTIMLKRAVNENRASENHRVLGAVHPQIIEAGAHLVKDLGVRLAGLDLMCTDISCPLSQNGGAFNEVNTTPGLHHHYLIASGTESVPVADLVLEHIFTHREGVMVV